MSTKKDGSERLNFTAFYERCCWSPSVSAWDRESARGRVKGPVGRMPSDVARVQGNGHLLVGKAYTALLDIQSGDELEIKLGKQALRLMPLGGGGGEGE